MATSELRVMLVEDSPQAKARLVELMQEVEHVTVTDFADTEAAAIATIAVAHPNVVVLDLRLRDGTGFGVLRSLRAAADQAGSAIAEQPVMIVITNYALPEYRRAVLALGADYFLDKSSDLDQLPAILERLVH